MKLTDGEPSLTDKLPVTRLNPAVIDTVYWYIIYKVDYMYR